MAPEDIPPGLAPLPLFGQPDAAQRHCPHDSVVWPDPGSGYFHGPRSPRFATAEGGFACLQDALAAGYWDTNPFSGGGQRRDRAFPIDPTLRPESGA